MDPEKRSRCLGRGVRNDCLSGMLRTFPQAINGTASLILDTNCVFCGGWILYAIIEPRSLEFPQPFRLVPRFADRGIPEAELRTGAQQHPG